MRIVGTNIIQARLAVGRVILAIALTGLALAQAGADDIFWNEPAGGMFDDPNNWLPQQVPGPDDAAQFNLGKYPAYIVTFPAQASVFNTRCVVQTDQVEMDLNGATYSLSSDWSIGVGDAMGDVAWLRMTGGYVETQRVAVGQAEGSQGTLELGAGLLLNASIELPIGDAGTGELMLVDAAVVSTPAARLGYGSSGYGYIGVYGPDTLLGVEDNITVGLYGEGALDVAQGGTAATNWLLIGCIDGPGYATVSDPNSLLSVHEGIYVGDGATGWLSIQGGAAAETKWLEVGTAADGDGTLDVLGPDSNLMITEGLKIGLWGTGSLSVTDGAEVRTLTPPGWIILASETGSFGDAYVIGGGVLSADLAPIVVGNGGHGRLYIFEGAEVYSDGELLAAEQSGSTAEITIDGAG